MEDQVGLTDDYWPLYAVAGGVGTALGWSWLLLLGSRAIQMMKVSVHILTTYLAVILGIQDEKYWPLMPALPSCGYGKEGPGPRYSSLIHDQNPKDIVITEHHWYQVPILKFVERIPVEALFKSWMDMIQKIQNKAPRI